MNSSLSLGGAERVISTLANAWVERGYQVHLLLLSDEKQNSFYRLHPNIKVNSLNLLKNSKNLLDFFINAFQKVRKLRANIRHLNPSVVVSFSTETNLLALMSTRFLACRIIVSERSNPLIYPSKMIFKILRRFLYPWADWVVLQTEESKACFAKNQNLIVIQNPIKKIEEENEVEDKSPPNSNSNPRSNSNPSNNSNPFIIAMGRLALEKGFDELIDAFSMISDRYPDWQLKILGEGPCRKPLEKQIAALNLTHRVELPGAIMNPDDYLKNAAFLVLSSHFEGFPNALCEAMALGIPCISYDCQFGPASLIESGVNGLLVEPRNKRKLSVAMERLIQNPEERKRLGENALLIRERLSLDKILTQWDHVLFKDKETDRSNNRNKNRSQETA